MLIHHHHHFEKISFLPPQARVGQARVGRLPQGKQLTLGDTLSNVSHYVMDTSLVTMSLTEECTLNEFVIQTWCVH